MVFREANSENERFEGVGRGGNAILGGHFGDVYGEGDRTGGVGVG